MIEIARTTDINALMAWRAEVIRNVFGEEPGEGLLTANRRYFEKHIADGTHIAVVAEYDGKACGCGAACLTDELPSPDNPSGLCA
ncbi:MAG: GNAT family N-acetyltransferase, partial [Muribaculaceae bacterium]|nr:GNAT family N-acetyltransferase [Muribaculaceae bacterium]